MKKIYILSLFFICFIQFGFSQDEILVNSTELLKEANPPDSIPKYVITKNNGQTYIGVILADDGREVLIETDALGKIYIPKSEIKSIVLVKDKSDVKHGEYNASGPFTTRYAFTTNALPITKGENYALLNLYGPEVHFAVTNNLNIGVMSTWAASPFVFAAKYSHKTSDEKINYSIGALVGTSGYFNNFRGVGGLYFANLTYGDRKNNFTFSLGYAHLKSGSYNDQYLQPGTYTNEFGGGFYEMYQRSLKPVVQGPMCSIAGIAKVGAKASFVFDSMLGYFNSERNSQVSSTLPNGYTQLVVKNVETQSLAFFFMPGMRFQSADNKAFQISLAGVTLKRLNGFSSNNSVSFPIPMASWFFKF